MMRGFESSKLTRDEVPKRKICPFSTTSCMIISGFLVLMSGAHSLVVNRERRLVNPDKIISRSVADFSTHFSMKYFPETVFLYFWARKFMVVKRLISLEMRFW